MYKTVVSVSAVTALATVIGAAGYLVISSIYWDVQTSRQLKQLRAYLDSNPDLRLNKAN